VRCGKRPSRLTRPNSGIRALGVGHRVAGEHDAEHGDVVVLERFDRQQRVIDGSERCARHDDHRRVPAREQVDLQHRAVQRHEHASGAFDDEPIVITRIRQSQMRDVDFDAVQFGCAMRRQRLTKDVALRQQSRRRHARHCGDALAVGTVRRARLNRLPVIRIQRERQHGRDHRLADIGCPFR
jgi:hypothetical protein